MECVCRTSEYGAGIINPWIVQHMVKIPFMGWKTIGRRIFELMLSLDVGDIISYMSTLVD